LIWQHAYVEIDNIFFLLYGTRRKEVAHSSFSNQYYEKFEL